MQNNTPQNLPVATETFLYADRAEYMREYRKRNRKKLNQQMNAYYAAHPEARLKRSARKKVDTEIRAGRLIKLPCEVDGCTETKVEAHHNDYSKPLDVTWLCIFHHVTHERHQKTARVCSKM